jgi:predicted nucleic acid-binding protein
MAAKLVFLDTCGWLALLNASDALHTTAKAAWRDFGRRGYSIVLTELVLLETGNGLARTPARRLLRPSLEKLRASPRTQIISASRDLLDRALDLYDRRSDKSWGLVDCVSFSVMQDLGVLEAFTNDRHFEQAGFRCLLPQPS